MSKHHMKARGRHHAAEHDHAHAHERSGFHGSPKETHAIHGGLKFGEDGQLPSAGPGRMTHGMKPDTKNGQTEGGEASARKGAPKGLKAYSEE